jgi:hypothetical protein
MYRRLYSIECWLIDWWQRLKKDHYVYLTDLSGYSKKWRQGKEQELWKDRGIGVYVP